MDRLVLAFITGNTAKFREALRAVKPYGISLVQRNAEKLEIQSASLEEISLRAAKEAYRILGEPLVVEDSGLFVESLKGFPGPYSSYVYKTIGVPGLLKLLEGETHRRACFRAAVALVTSCYEGVFIGETCGVIAGKARGSRGFGFDPVFIPEGASKTFAEMSLEEKNKYSHRAKAFSRMASYVASNPSIISCGDSPVSG
ncbi:MAG: XTP/dITP diphosphatase [Desulfurococcales archaeon]|nr:XTP/dITP diphosphatase [Desulfurococcales archaeon]